MQEFTIRYQIEYYKGRTTSDWHKVETTANLDKMQQLAFSLIFENILKTPASLDNIIQITILEIIPIKPFPRYGYKESFQTMMKKLFKPA